jgi:hypothetical protein
LCDTSSFEIVQKWHRGCENPGATHHLKIAKVVNLRRAILPKESLRIAGPSQSRVDSPTGAENWRSCWEVREGIRPVILGECDLQLRPMINKLFLTYAWERCFYEILRQTETLTKSPSHY